VNSPRKNTAASRTIYGESGGEDFDSVTFELVSSALLGGKIFRFIRFRSVPLKPKISAAPHGL